MTEVRLGWYANEREYSDVWLMGSFPSRKDHDFAWGNFENGQQIVEAALEIVHRDKYQLSPTLQWRQTVNVARHYSQGSLAVRNKLIERICSALKTSNSEDRKFLNGKSLKRLKVFFQISF